jgi:hypothetical protein
LIPLNVAAAASFSLWQTTIEASVSMTSTRRSRPASRTRGNGTPRASACWAQTTSRVRLVPPPPRRWSHLKRSLGNPSAGGDHLAAVVKSRLKRIQYRPELTDAFFVQSGLTLDPNAR